MLTAYGDEDLSKTTDITTFPDAIACVTELYELNMWGNNLATIPALGTAGLNLVKLGIVDFGSNQINTIAANTFTGLTEMKQLRLDNNQIPSIPAGLFTSEHAALQHVLISDNYIARMPYRLFTGTKCTDTTFDMARNVLKCDSYVSKGADPCKCDQSHAQVRAPTPPPSKTLHRHAFVPPLRIFSLSHTHGERHTRREADRHTSPLSLSACLREPHRRAVPRSPTGK